MQIRQCLLCLDRIVTNAAIPFPYFWAFCTGCAALHFILDLPGHYGELFCINGAIYGVAQLASNSGASGEGYTALRNDATNNPYENLGFGYRVWVAHQGQWVKKSILITQPEESRYRLMRKHTSLLACLLHA